MRRLIFYLLIFSFLVSDSLLTSDNNDKRIRFKKGESSVTVSGKVSGEAVTYILTAKAGQNMIVSVTGNVFFNIKDLKTGLFLEHATELDDAREWEGRLPSSGDYRITVSSDEVDKNYNLTVKIN
ncbi:MAG: hypothetical protein N2510_08810 [Ignavibacteria bacterium]|nr:hypothetical protein [Ignavibacteria bacterium]